MQPSSDAGSAPLTLWKRVAAFAALAALCGCVGVDYVGKTYPPTANVDVYFSRDDIDRPYESIGIVRAQVEALPFTNPGQQLQDKLVAEARARGADGIIIGDLGSRQVNAISQTQGQATSKKKGNKKNTQYNETTTTTTSDITELSGTLIRYKQ